MYSIENFNRMSLSCQGLLYHPEIYEVLIIFNPFVCWNIWYNKCRRFIRHTLWSFISNFVFPFSHCPTGRKIIDDWIRYVSSFTSSFWFDPTIRCRLERYLSGRWIIIRLEQHLPSAVKRVRYSYTVITRTCFYQQRDMVTRSVPTDVCCGFCAPHLEICWSLLIKTFTLRFTAAIVLFAANWLWYKNRQTFHVTA